jgi:predicted extracellular nuclease
MMHDSTVRVRRSLLAGALLAATSLALSTSPASGLGGGSGVISLATLGAASTQDFDTLANTGTTNNLTIPGWFLNENGSSSANNGQYQAGTGSSNAGDAYSFGATASAERAFGSLLSGSLNATIGASFANNTGVTVTALDVSYVGELWRAAAVNRAVADRLDFQLSTDATSLTTGTWVDYNALDFNGPASATTGALNGNAAPNQAAVSASITGLSIAAGATFWIRWSDSDISPGADDGLAIDNFSITPRVSDLAPEVVNTFPANGATDFPVGANLSVTFSEPVNVSTSWFTLLCSVSGLVATTSSGGPTVFTLDPAVALTNGETCTLTVLANQVSDQDAVDPPDNMVVNFVVGFTAFDVCQASITSIPTIQGSGLSTPIPGTVATKGVVVGDFEGAAGQQGFYMQDLTGDGNPATSDGIFVFTGTADLVSVGQVVRVIGFARERFNQTTINGSNSNGAAVPAGNIVQCGTGSVAPTDVLMPFVNADTLEPVEGMLVRFPQPLVIAEYFNYDRFGEIVLAQPLAGETRPFSGTSIDEPGAAANARTLANSLRRITLDDGLGTQNPAVLRHPNGAAFSLANRFRGGDTVANTTGVIGYDFGVYRIQPTAGASYTAVNPRPAAPDPVGGTLRVAAMNTLNFFVTLDYPTGNPLDNKCGPALSLECRGADFDQPLEFTRQRDKLIAALAGLDADVIGLNELENTTGVDPVGNIVDGLNAVFGPGTYAAINTGTIGTDAIRVGMIYRPAKVTPAGAFQVLDSSDDPRFIDTKSRPALAQTFTENASGGRFTAVVNHLKSKGSACDDVGDPDLGDGQGNCSGTRTLAAQALVDWLATDPTGSGDPDFLIMGDLNSYAQENPIDAIKVGADDTAGTGDDFTNLIAQFQGTYAYSYTFDGQAGYLDHSLANANLFPQVTAAADWHLNSDEPDVLDYDTSFKPPAQDALYEPNGYRSSDHDPVVVGLILNVAPVANAGGPYSLGEGGSVALSGSTTDTTYATNATYEWDLDNNGSYETAGQTPTFSAAGLDGPTSVTVGLRVTDELGLSGTAQATINVSNVAPTVSASFAAASISCGIDNATLTVNFSDPAAADTHTATITWGDGTNETVSGAISPVVRSHTYAAAGVYTASVSVVDDDGGAGDASATTTVRFTSSGFLPPINADGTSVFKYKSTIPVKIRLTDCDGSTPANLAPTIRLTMVSGATPGLEINEPESTSGADTTGVMRFSSNQYIYNLATKPLPDSSAIYRITVTVPATGQTATVQFGLRP